MKPKVILRMMDSKYWFYRYRATGRVQLMEGDPLSTYQFVVSVAKPS